MLERLPAMLGNEAGMKRAAVAVGNGVSVHDVRPLISAAGAIAAFVALTPSCNGDATECECNPPGFTVTITPGGTEDAPQLVASGPACVHATVACTSAAPADVCATYRVVPSASGTCHVDLFFSGGTDDEQDVNIVQASGCCSGLYADPASAGQVDFPSPGVSDGGGGDA